MCNNTNYGYFICYSCDAIHHCQGTRCWGLRRCRACSACWVGVGLLPEQRAEPNEGGEGGKGRL